MFSWAALFTLIGVVGSAIAIFEFIRLRQPQPRRLAIICAAVFIALLIFSIVFRNILSPPGNLVLTPVPTSNTSQSGTGNNPTQAPTTSSNPNLPYSANWSNGLNGWAGTSQWRAQGGMLVSDGSNGYAANDILAPVQMGQISDYTVRASIQIISCSTTVSDCSVGILVRQATYNGEQNGYVGAVDNFRDDHYIPSYADIHTGNSNACRSCAIQPIQYTYYTPDHNSHTYQVTVQGTHIRFSIDGNVLVQVADTSFAMGGQAGLEDTNAQIIVSSFEITSV